MRHWKNLAGDVTHCSDAFLFGDALERAFHSHGLNGHPDAFQRTPNHALSEPICAAYCDKHRMT